MSATEKLRALLDERGVEYSTKDSAFRDITYWPASNRVVASYSCSKYSETENGMFKTQFTPEQAIAATMGGGTMTADDIRDLIEHHSYHVSGNMREFFNGAYEAIADELNATLSRHRAKSHPYGYEHDTGAYDCTRCECGCINDISATYCSDCGGEIEIDESAEKEYYDGYGKRAVFAEKHDDGSLEVGERRYVTEDAATLGSGTLTAEQVKRIHAVIEKHWHDLPADYDMPEATALPEYSYDWQAIADELNATLGSGTCTVTPDFNCSNCGKQIGVVRNCEMYETCDGRQAWKSLDHEVCDVPNYCPSCGRRVKGGAE